MVLDRRTVDTPKYGTNPDVRTYPEAPDLFRVTLPSTKVAPQGLRGSEGSSETIQSSIPSHQLVKLIQTQGCSALDEACARGNTSNSSPWREQVSS